MTRATLVGILLLTWVAQPLDAQRAYKCLLVDPKDPSTCVPPPCEFMAGLELAKARQRARAKFPTPPPGSSLLARERFLDSLVAETVKERAAYRRCGGRPIPDFSMRPAPSCEIGETLENLTRTGGTCTELIEARYEGAKTRQELCQADSPALRAAVAGKLTLIAAEQEVRYLKVALLGYLASCVPDAELSRQLSDAGLDALKSVGKTLRDNWLAKRASAPAAGGRGR